MKHTLFIMALWTLFAARPPAVHGAIDDPSASVPRGTLALQPVGVPFQDTAFDSTLRRLTGATTSGGYATQIYSQLQAFSSDNRYVLLIENEVYVVRRLSDLALMPGIDSSEWNAPRWQPALSHTLVSYDTNGDNDLTVQYTNVDTQVTTDHYTFPAQYLRIRGNQSFDELSHDGRWMGGMATRSDGVDVIFSLDLTNRTLGAVLPLNTLYGGACQPDPVWGAVEPDWIGVSPRGTYLVVQWARDGTARCSGLETFNIQTGAFTGRVNEGHQHGDLGVMTNGTEFFMSIEFSSPMDVNRPALAYRPLPGTATVGDPVYLQVMDWSNGLHISCQGPEDVCLVSYGGWDGDGWTPFEKEVFLQYVDGSVSRLAHHRSSECGYWVQPRGSLSRNGALAIFASDWRDGTGGGSCGGNELGEGEAYIVEINGSQCGNGMTEEGEACDDGDMINGNGCDNNCTVSACGNGILSAGETCDDGNLVNGDCCSSGCTVEPSESDCGDNDVCNGIETCNGSGQCIAGTALDCSDGDLCTADVCDPTVGCSNSNTPVATCNAPLRSSVKMATTNGNRLRWKWNSPAATVDLGDPTATTEFAVCVWDYAAGIPQLATTIPVGVGNFWTATRSGMIYRDPLGTVGGIQLLKLKVRPSGAAKVILRASGANLPLPAPVNANQTFTNDPSVVFQLVNSEGSCWTTDFANPDDNNGEEYNASTP